MTSVSVTREVAADPTSVALLLAGPAAGELWPHVREVHASSTDIDLLVRIPNDRDVETHLDLDPPARTATAFHVSFDVNSSALPPAVATPTITAAGDAKPARLSEVTLNFDVHADSAGRLELIASEYLANLSSVAEARATE